nr:zinc finger protein CONSTANS-LIKE 2 [Ipomoea batatas]
MSGAQGAQPKESRTATTYESIPQEENKTRLDIRSREDEKGIEIDKIQDKVKDAAGKGGPVFGAEESENACIDLLEYSSCQENQFNDHHYSLNQPHHYSVPEKNMSYGGDSVVPNKTHLQYYHTHNQTHHGSFQLQGMEYETSTPGYGYPAYSHSVSVSSMDVGVVPESTTSDVSISHSRPPKGTIDLFSGPPVAMPSQLAPMDREARVLRYREKKKTRKFEKTIRYASRKAYAETRPRIKGRFAKRTDAEGEVDQMFFTPSMAESGYGIVPLL